MNKDRFKRSIPKALLLGMILLSIALFIIDVINVDVIINGSLYRLESGAIMVAFAFAAAITAFFSPRWKILIGLSLAILMPLANRIFTIIFLGTSNIDSEILTFNFLIFEAVLLFPSCLLGAAFGSYMSPKCIDNSENDGS